MIGMNRYESFIYVMSSLGQAIRENRSLRTTGHRTNGDLPSTRLGRMNPPNNWLMI